ncbi:glycosyl hydrolase [Raphidocelis subcapitata]|uniref:Glycosyl hydrolase n=1 Tax=Raphidocelis subcapitata TaxID=307507 RepID=A0A2V0NZS5_9CHLO|nr:glycosyl hydrolase [Raphidocelis subcapitata]|eukprot:GBF93138.1 glycosyl hydrolase [Raphidocelis subcapitata]
MRLTAAAAAALLVALALARASAAALPPRQKVLADGLKAVRYYADLAGVTNSSQPGRLHHPECGWEYATFMTGVARLRRETGDPGLRRMLQSFGDQYGWQMCPLNSYPYLNPGESFLNPDNQLCAATYIEVYDSSPLRSRNDSWIEWTRRQYDSEIQAGHRTYWSWVDALYMSMNVLARLGEVTGEQAYYDHMWRNFEYGVGPEGYNFWDEEESLFYRDPPSQPGTPPGVFWSRGNGWALGALVAAIEHSPADEPHRGVYVDYFKNQTARLAKLQGADGCWRSSLTRADFNPLPETTGTALFTYGMAWGIKAGLLDDNTFRPVVEKAWECLTTVSLQPSGRVGNCQPVGAAPGRNIGPESTSSFCVGQFALAASAVSKIAPGRR